MINRMTVETSPYATDCKQRLMLRTQTFCASPSAAWQSVAYGLVSTVILFIIAFLLPEKSPNSLLPIIYCFAMRQLVSYLQETPLLVTILRRNKGFLARRNSSWRCFSSGSFRFCFLPSSCCMRCYSRRRPTLVGRGGGGMFLDLIRPAMALIEFAPPRQLKRYAANLETNHEDTQHDTDSRSSSSCYVQ